MTGRVLAAAMVVMACACGAAWGTDVDYNILENTTWTAAGSPYVIVRTVVQVRFNRTLTIGPGVTVRFQPGTSIAVEEGSSIMAVGAPAESGIVFTSNSLPPAVGDWLQVGLSSSSGSSFSYCTFEYAQKGLYLSVSSPSLQHCTFQLCQTGLHLYRSSPAIASCDVTDCTVAGILCEHRETAPVIHECNISNPLWNIYLTNYLSPLVTIDATHNWWGTNTPTAIADKIHDRFKDPSVYGEVDYAEYYSSPGVEPTSWGSIKALFRE